MNKKELISNLIWFAGVFAVIMIVRLFIFMPVVVSGDSMNPTMVDHERVFALKNTKLKRFDIVTFPAPDIPKGEPKKSYIKRVIGLPGDTVEYKADQLIINGKEYDEPYLDEYKGKIDSDEFLTVVYDGEGKTHENFDLSNLFESTTVPEGKVFVLGDNRQNSKDSRMIGFIDEKAITGNVKFSFWPISKFGKVE